MQFGIQMYGARPEWQSDPKSFFERVREFGYGMIEPCFSLVEGRDMSGFGFIDPQKFIGDYLPVIRSLGMTVPSVHIISLDLPADCDRLLALAETIGNTQFVVGCPRELDRQSLDALAASMKLCADRLAEHGLRLLVHNNPPEVLAKVDGVTAYEYLVRAAGDNVGFQPDLGWIAAGGEDPEAFLWRNERKVWSIHYKDYDYASSGEAPIGKGDLDLRACFQFARAHGIPQIADQDSDVMTHAANTLRFLASLGQYRANTSSILCTLDVDTGELTELHRFDDRIIEAPNWLVDGDTLLYNSGGRIWRYSISRDAEQAVDTGSCVRCNNDHVPSPDCRRLAISCGVGEGFSSHIFIVDLENGGEPVRVTENSPSFLHGWSPDGKELCYCAFRDTGVDIFAIGADGGDEWRITRGEGFNDGAEYSPDGRHIWFNSTRSGLMQCWRMDRDGGNPTQLTDSDANNWFPHVSPDMRRVVYLTFKKGELDPQEHLSNMNVSLSVMDYNGSNKRKLIDFFGGQGSINVNSWSPDSKKVALVIYELSHK